MTSAIPPRPFEGELVGVKKKGRKRGSKGNKHEKSGSQRAMEKKQGEQSDRD